MLLRTGETSLENDDYKQNGITAVKTSDIFAEHTTAYAGKTGKTGSYNSQLKLRISWNARCFQLGPYGDIRRNIRTTRRFIQNVLWKVAKTNL